MKRPSVWLLLTPALLLAAPVGLRAQSPADTSASADQPPIGYGTLKQDDLAIRLRSENLEVRFVPLDERVIRLLAPDAYGSLRGLVASRQAAIDSVGRLSGVSEPGLALVSFYGQQAGVRFDPQLVTIGVRGRVLQPIGIIPLNPTFSSQQLNVRQQASALYLFEEKVPVTESFQVSYGALTSDDWGNRLVQLERERGRVAARSRQDTSRQ